MIVKIWYKTGSQWPGEFSYLGTRSENFLPRVAAGRQNNRWGEAQAVQALGPGFLPAEPWGPLPSLQPGEASHIQAGSCWERRVENVSGLPFHFSPRVGGPGASLYVCCESGDAEGPPATRPFQSMGDFSSTCQGAGVGTGRQSHLCVLPR